MCATANKYFFGGSVEKPVKIYKHLKDEVWLNCGCNVGDTIFGYYAKGLSAKKIFAVDNDKKAIALLNDNTLFLPEKCREVIRSKATHIDKNTDFKDLFENEQLTFINADIEGAELQLVTSMIEVIRRDRLVLALCLYHEIVDIYKISIYLMKHLEGYN